MTWGRGPWASGPWGAQEAPAGGASHATDGALAAEAAVIAGTATHLTLHATSGALQADAATVDGTSVHSGAGAELPSAKGAGKSRKRRKKYTVEIDGETLVVGSEAEAVEILEKVAEKAKATAEVAISRAAKAKKKPASDVLKDARKALKPPDVTVSPGLDAIADMIRRGVESTYADAMQTIEITALMHKRAREDEDDEDVLLLLV